MPTLPATFNLEAQPPSVLALFEAIFVSTTTDPDSWARVSRELPVRLLDLSGHPALEWWEYTRAARPQPRSVKRAAAIPPWLWAMLDDPMTTPDTIRRTGEGYGISYPPRRTS